MRIRELLKDNVFLICFSAFVGAVASHMLEGSLTHCATYLPNWIPADDCRSVTMLIFPVAIVAFVALALAALSLVLQCITYVQKLRLRTKSIGSPADFRSEKQG